MTLPAPIPDHAVLLHVGMPKSGTTAIQRACAQRRPELGAHGVSYPGSRHNHSQASNDVAGRRGDASAGTHWTGLLREVQRQSGHRVLLSHEFFAEHPVDVCRRIVTELDRDVHVVFTLRNQASLLGSAWQQSLKSGGTATFDEWLRTTIGPQRSERTSTFDHRTLLAATVRKWAEIVGPERVTLVILDRAEPERLTRAFEALLDVPAGLLTDVDLGPAHANRSLNAAEAELLRQVNLTVADALPEDRSTFRAIYRGGGIDRVLAREPGANEPRITAPQWAVDAMVERAQVQVLELRQLGLRVVGELDTLAAPVPAEATTPPPVTELPVTLASELAAGIIGKALDLDAQRRTVPRPRSRTTAPAHPRTRSPRVAELPLREQVRASTRHTVGLPLRVLALATAGRIALLLRSALRGPGTTRRKR